MRHVTAARLFLVPLHSDGCEEFYRRKLRKQRALRTKPIHFESDRLNGSNVQLEDPPIGTLRYLLFKSHRKS